EADVDSTSDRADAEFARGQKIGRDGEFGRLRPRAARVRLPERTADRRSRERERRRQPPVPYLRRKSLPLAAPAGKLSRLRLYPGVRRRRAAGRRPGHRTRRVGGSGFYLASSE